MDKPRPLTVFILVTLIFLAWFLSYCVTYENQVIEFNKKLGQIDINDADFNTGDLILFRYDCSREGKFRTGYPKMITSIISKWPMPFSHIGFILKINGEAYIAHSANYAIKSATGDCLGNKTDVYLLKDYLDNYHGNIYWSKYTGPKLDSYRFYKKYERLEHLPFRFDAVTGIDYLIGTDLLNRKHSTVSCSGCVMQIMDEMNVIFPCSTGSVNYNHYTPNEVFIECYKTGKYSTPVIINNKYMKGIPVQSNCDLH